MTLREAILPVAVAEIGVTEIGNSNCGIRVNEYKAATWLDPNQAWAWCAAFVDWVIKQAMDRSGVHGTLTFQRPKTAGAWDLENWSLEQDNSTWLRKPHRNDIEPGDILIYTFSHCGFAESAPSKAGYVKTIEGNTDAAGSRDGGGVWRKKRHVSQIRSRIRFRV